MNLKCLQKVLEDVNNTGSLLLRVIDEGEELMPQAPKALATSLKKEMDSLTKLWLPLKGKCEEKTLKLASVSEQVVAYHFLHGDCTEWLNDKEAYFKALKPCSRYLPSIINQVHQHKVLVNCLHISHVDFIKNIFLHLYNFFLLQSQNYSLVSNK